jgi:ferredoxin-type protein NapF
MSGRRGVLGALFSKKGNENLQTLCARPPYHQALFDFQTVCSQCQDTPCVGACEEEIIFLDAAHTPCLDFTRRGCTFCEACAKACPSGVLDVSSPATISVNVKIDMLKCMAWHQSLCHSCLDACEVNAISFLGLFRPSIDDSACTGCGGCVGICPSEAICVSSKEA